MTVLGRPRIVGNNLYARAFVAAREGAVHAVDVAKRTGMTLKQASRTLCLLRMAGVLETNGWVLQRGSRGRLRVYALGDPTVTVERLTESWIRRRCNGEFDDSADDVRPVAVPAEPVVQLRYVVNEATAAERERQHLEVLAEALQTTVAALRARGALMSVSRVEAA